MHKNKQAAFAMVEVLVAMLVIVVGLLGMMAFQMQGLRNNLRTQSHSQAIILAYDMAERMRSNRGGWEDGDYDAITDKGSEVSCSDCSYQQTADNDAYRWISEIEGVLPGHGSEVAVGTVMKENGGGNKQQWWNISITWYEKAELIGGDPVEKNYLLTVTR
ncbi:type IV pilus assembly protein PilV [Sinobacterium caligoides]|uniref:Type IV pilus assembly protein PilV n=1 Tax=Sinobacterium caligoides TaxID=933926 RepID=A0A3N2D4M2_9GAMM|nr:type IV pilus modification protein PilV [Sinobacterium caligoides]ROR94746.1 type IV pilus assembly protein PilV [Sinobacterium caligoides]